jgi:hypothetical protein
MKLVSKSSGPVTDNILLWYSDCKRGRIAGASYSRDCSRKIA